MIRRDENNLSICHKEENESGYKRVLPEQYVIHLRSFQGGFAYSEIEGITSPAYTVFGLSDEGDIPLFWKHVFKTDFFIRSLVLVTYGIRDGRSISYDDFSTMTLTSPNGREQSKIANLLETYDTLITLHQCRLI